MRYSTTYLVERRRDINFNAQRVVLVRELYFRTFLLIQSVMYVRNLPRRCTSWAYNCSAFAEGQRQHTHCRGAWPTWYLLHSRGKMAAMWGRQLHISTLTIWRPAYCTPPSINTCTILSLGQIVVYVAWDVEPVFQEVWGML